MNFYSENNNLLCKEMREGSNEIEMVQKIPHCWDGNISWVHVSNILTHTKDELRNESRPIFNMQAYKNLKQSLRLKVHGSWVSKDHLCNQTKKLIKFNITKVKAFMIQRRLLAEERTIHRMNTQSTNWITQEKTNEPIEASPGLE